MAVFTVEIDCNDIRIHDEPVRRKCLRVKCRKFSYLDLVAYTVSRQEA